METLESAMATIVEKMAVCKYYATIYADTSKAHLESQALQGRFELALPRLYEAVLAFVEKAKEYFDSSKPGTKKGPWLRLYVPLLIEAQFRQVKNCSFVQAFFGWGPTVTWRYFRERGGCSGMCRDGYNGNGEEYVVVILAVH